MKHKTAAVQRFPRHTAIRPGPPRRRSVLTTLALLAGSLTSVALTTLAGAPSARADTVPPPPAGWTTVFGDNFAGPAGSAPSSSNWFYELDQQRLPGRQWPPGAEGHEQRWYVDVRADREHAR